MESPQIQAFRRKMGCAQPLVGMVHLLALPGTPGYGGSVQAIIDAALRDAATLKQAGFDVLLLENMHDLPYLRREVGHEVSTAMTLAAYLVKRAFALPTGLQILAGANLAALAAAHSAGLDFIRAEGFVFGHVADEGWMDGDAGALLRYRRQIGADGVMVFCDIKKKHAAHAMTADVSLRETAHAAEFFKSDGVIVTGAATGRAAAPEDLAEVYGHTQLPILVGSGVTAENVDKYRALCDGFIVGSAVKRDGNWQNEVDYERAVRLVAAFRQKN